MTLLAAPALPSELRGAWVWPHCARPQDRRTASPSGVLLSHGDHVCLVLWVTVTGAPTPNRLISLEPLTLAEKIVCATCAASGRIIADRWEPC